MKIEIKKFTCLAGTIWIEIHASETDKAPYQSISFNVAIPYNEKMNISDIELAAKNKALELITTVSPHLGQL